MFEQMKWPLSVAASRPSAITHFILSLNAPKSTERVKGLRRGRTRFAFYGPDKIASSFRLGEEVLIVRLQLASLSPSRLGLLFSQLFSILFVDTELDGSSKGNDSNFLSSAPSDGPFSAVWKKIVWAVGGHHADAIFYPVKLYQRSARAATEYTGHRSKRSITSGCTDFIGRTISPEDFAPCSLPPIGVGLRRSLAGPWYWICSDSCRPRRDKS